MTAAGPVGLRLVAVIAFWWEVGGHAVGVAGVGGVLGGSLVGVVGADGGGVGAVRRGLCRCGCDERRRGDDISREEGLRWLWLACHVARLLWDEESWEVLSTRHLQLSRDIGALAVLHVALNQRMGVYEHGGELAAAASLLGEAEVVGETTGRGLYGALALAPGGAAKPTSRS